MISATDKRSHLWRLWVTLIAVLLVVCVMLGLTRPAAQAISMTPLNRLIKLETFAAKAIPYEEALANQKPTLIEFYANWCTTCQDTSATVEALNQQYGDRINFVMLNVDSPQWAPQVAHYSAFGVPQFTLIGANLQPVKNLGW